MTTQNTSSSAVQDEDAIDVDGMERHATGGTRFKSLPFKDGSAVYRILPPFGPTAKEKGFPFAEIFLHWWRKEGSKSGFPVLCIQKPNEPDSCPMCAAVDKVKGELVKLLAPYTTTVGDKQKVDWDSVPKATANKAKWANDCHWQRAYYYNAVTPSGEIGVLKVAKTLGDKLNAEIRKCVKDRQFNPVSRKEGVNFLLSRTQLKNKKYEFTVELQKKIVKLQDGDTAEKIVKEPLKEEVLAKLDTEMRDLYKLFKAQTPESLKKIMEGKGKDSTEFAPGELDDEDSAPESKASSKPTAESDDVSDPTEDDVDQLAAELGVTE